MNTVTLTAATGNITGTSSKIVVSAAAAAKLVFTSAPPSSVVRNSTFNVTVQLEDKYGNYVSHPGVNIGLQQAGGGTLNGAHTVTTNAAGQAVFTNLSEGADGQFTLDATASGLTSASAETSVIY